MQNQIVLPSLKHTNSLAQSPNAHWADLGERRAALLGAKYSNPEDMHPINSKGLRECNSP